MNVIAQYVRVIHMALALSVLGVLSAAAAPASVTRTNLVDRWLTNVVEVRMSANRFVDEYHTNWVRRVTTNVVDVYATNHVLVALTNRVVIDLPRTNFVTAYQTNVKTLHLTNWATVLIFKTNWVTQPITNVVQIDLARTAVPGTEDEITKAPGEHTATVAAPKNDRQIEGALTPTSSQNALAMEAKREGRVTGNGSVEVRLSVRWTNNANMPVQVQQWRIEREDGSILCFGQDQEFKRALPVGKYKVEVKAQRDNGPLLAGLGTLAVMPREVLLQQRAAGNN
jgi:hypothetical protein